MRHNGGAALRQSASETAPEARFLFTAPWDPIVVRRGDALGLRALTDVFAETVAPGLSNRVRDGRWVTILAWALARSQDVFHASGGHSVATRSKQGARYAWLRPLELIWVARTLALAQDWRHRPLPGRRSVGPWYEQYKDGHSAERFSMSADQFRAYRQTGVYGGYRVAFRKWPGMTAAGDGWTPDTQTNRLAEWLDARLGPARPSWPLHAGHGDDHALSTRSAKLGLGQECRWWLQHWGNFGESGRHVDENTLPRRRDETEILPEVELLKPLIFGSDPGGTRRRQVAVEIARSRAENHIGICEHLGRVLPDEAAIGLLPSFSRLADAGMAAMDLVAKALGSKSRVAVDDVASLAPASSVCKELKTAAIAWQSRADMQLRHIESAHRFAAAVPSARPNECLRKLLQYHELYGGGARWFVLRGDHVEPRMRPGNGASGYGFRLYSLCRLATQCGVIRRMPAALRDDEEAIEAEE
jgi:hypothetical protein